MKKEKIVFIGNSIVKGFPFKNSQSFVGLLRENTKLDIINKGVNGDTSDGIISRFEKDVLSFNPTKVFIMSGTNDFIHNLKTPQETAFSILEMVDISHSHNIETYVLTPIPLDVDMATRLWMVGSNINFNEIQKLLEEYKKELLLSKPFSSLNVIDLYSSYMNFSKNSGSNISYHDGLHPSLKGHQFIFEFLKTSFPFFNC